MKDTHDRKRKTKQTRATKKMTETLRFHLLMQTRIGLLV